MRKIRPRTALWATLLALAIVLPAAAGAQSRQTYNYTVGLSLGIGGSADSQPETSYDNLTFQGLFAMRIDRTTVWGARLGRIDLDFEDGGSGDLLYLTVAGEYLYPGDFYETGLFFGLGVYDLDAGPYGSTTAVGVTLGVTGDFAIGERWSLITELSGHYAGLDSLKFFGMVHAGVAWRF